jgi:hypothetical protein
VERDVGLPGGAGPRLALGHQPTAGAVRSRRRVHAEHPDVRLARFERRVAVPVAHPALQLEGDAADDPAFFDRHEDRGPRGPLADVREPGEVSLPVAVVVRRDELAVGLGRDPAGFGMVLGQSLAGHDRHGRGRVPGVDGQPD